MIERSWIEIDSKYIIKNYVQFLKHTKKSNALVVIFPGGDNSTEIPTLHYARKAALLKGCDVLSLQYGVHKGNLEINDNERYKVLVEECFQAINKVNNSDYERLFFISKSLGNSMALDVDKAYFNSKIVHIFYTPLSQMVDQIIESTCLILTGTKDKYFGSESIEKLVGFSNVEIHQFENAVHSLEINDDVWESIKILEKATKVCSEYIEAHLNS
jgi:tRNA nucleotidyltransferase/poly(A) polymerase